MYNLAIRKSTSPPLRNQMTFAKVSFSVTVLGALKIKEYITHLRKNLHFVEGKINHSSGVKLSNIGCFKSDGQQFTDGKYTHVRKWLTEINKLFNFFNIMSSEFYFIFFVFAARCAGSDGSMSASGSAGPGFDPQWCSKF